MNEKKIKKSDLEKIIESQIVLINELKLKLQYAEGYLKGLQEIKMQVNENKSKTKV